MGGTMDTGQIMLFVDHDPSVSGAVADALAAKMSLEVISATGFSLAEAFFERERLDILVADIRIPGTGIGQDFIRRFAERHPRAGIVLVSANPVIYTQFYPEYSVCLQKPYDTDQLAQAIMDAVQRAPDAA